MRLPRRPSQVMASALAHALLAVGDVRQPGRWPQAAFGPAALLARMCACLPARAARPALRKLARQLAGQPPAFWRRHTVPTLAAHLHRLPAFDTLAQRARPLQEGRGAQGLHWLLRPARMRAGPPSLPLALPDWPTPADLARSLGLSADELHWLTHPALGWRAPSALPGMAVRRGVAPHYRCILRPKARGGLRLIEAPLPRLKAVQRQLLRQLLAWVPPHEAAQAFVPGRGVASHAALHAGQPFVAAFDLRDFFHAIGAARVQALWRTLGYPEGTARALTALTTTRTPAALCERLREGCGPPQARRASRAGGGQNGQAGTGQNKAQNGMQNSMQSAGQGGGMDWQQARRLRSAHLPQGAPTSPALANLCAFRLDMRLAALAERFGARYSRYADDLVFSGPAALGARFRTLQAWVAAIARAEGFALHPAKTRRLPAHRQQRVTGLVVNQRPNLARADYDRLRAQLHRLARQSAQTPAPAALRPVLQGRLAWAQRFVCPSRADKLARLLAAIRWAA